MQVTTENEDLNLHVSLCEQRYKALEARLDGLETRLTKVEADLSALKVSMATGFNEIKLLIEKQSNARAIQIIAAAATVTASVVGLIGYLLTH